MNGLIIKKNFLTSKQLQDVTNFILNITEWNTSLKRLTKHYGYEYSYFSHGELKKADDIPEILLSLVSDIKVKDPFNQVIINRYTRGEGISPHIDHISYFGDTILCISVGESVNLKFDNNEKYLISNGDLYMLTEDARYKYKHSLKMSTSMKTKTRYSITYRYKK